MSFYNVDTDISNSSSFLNEDDVNPAYLNDTIASTSSTHYTGSFDAGLAPAQKQYHYQQQTYEPQPQSHKVVVPVNPLSQFQKLLPQQYQQQQQFQQLQRTQSLSTNLLNYGNTNTNGLNNFESPTCANFGQSSAYINSNSNYNGNPIMHRIQNQYTTTNPLIQQARGLQPPPEMRQYTMGGWNQMSPTQYNSSRISIAPSTHLSVVPSNQKVDDMTTNSWLQHNLQGQAIQRYEAPKTGPSALHHHMRLRAQRLAARPLTTPLTHSLMGPSLPSGSSQREEAITASSDEDSWQDIPQSTSQKGKRKRETSTPASETEELCQDAEPKSKKRKGAKKGEGAKKTKGVKNDEGPEADECPRTQELVRPQNYAAAAASDPELIPEQELKDLRDASPGITCRIAVVSHPASTSDQSASPIPCGILCKTAKDVAVHLEKIHGIRSEKSGNAIPKRCEWESCPEKRKEDKKPEKMKDLQRHSVEKHFGVCHMCPVRGCDIGNKDQEKGPLISNRAYNITKHLKDYHQKVGPEFTDYAYSMPLCPAPSNPNLAS